MECHLKSSSNQNIICKELPLGSGFLRFVTIDDDKPAHFEEHVAEIGKRAGEHSLIVPEVYGSSDLPFESVSGAGLTAFLGTNKDETFYRGIQACFVSEANAREIVYNGKKVGVHFEDLYAEYALIGGLTARNRDANRREQTLDVFCQMEEALQTAGMDFSHVVRTWFYNNCLLDWYDEFNRARDTFFESRGVFSRFVPASTGIGSDNRADSALLARVFAVHPKCDAVKVAEVESPLQCSAQDYRSSFSRAAELDHPLFRQLIVSGTASIAPMGETVHLNDPDKQIELSLDVIEAILKSRGMKWSDVVRSVAYLKDKRYATNYESIARRRGIDQMPCIKVQADICRDNLLFEMELDAAVEKTL